MEMEMEMEIGGRRIIIQIEKGEEINLSHRGYEGSGFKSCFVVERENFIEEECRGTESNWKKFTFDKARCSLLSLLFSLTLSPTLSPSYLAQIFFYTLSKRSFVFQPQNLSFPNSVKVTVGC